MGGVKKIMLLTVLIGNLIFPEVANIIIQNSILDSSNNLLLAGYGLVNNSSTESWVARYNPSGITDTTFNSTGYNLTLTGTISKSNGIAIQSSGNIVTAGFTYLNNITQSLVLRYTTTGVLDSTFGTEGIVTTQVNDGSMVNAVAIQSNDDIVAAGVSVQVGTPLLLVTRYTETGLLDTTFNSTGAIPGTVTTQTGSKASALDVALDSSGNIVVAGFAIINGQVQLCIARYTSAGVLDTTFGVSGIVTEAIGTYTQANAVAIDSSGNIVVAGYADTSLAIARFTSSGSLDTTFNSGGALPGVVTTSVGNKAQANDVLLDASGNIIVGGFSDSNMIVARYTSSGALDTTFGTAATGIFTFALGTASVCNSLVLQGTDIIASGYVDSNTLVISLSNSGTVNTTWATNGIINWPGNSNYFINMWEAESTGTNGGTFTAGAWQTRVLNSISSINNNTVVLSNNQFTLGPGTYTIAVIAPAYRVDNHQVRLQNITDGITVLYGTSSFSPNSGGTTSFSTIDGQFTVAQPTTFEIQHMCATTQTSDGLGIATGFGTSEMYTTVKIINNFSQYTF